MNFAVAFGTITAVLVALFGDWFQARLFAPKLELSLPVPRGELTQEEWKDAAGVHRQAVRYYHVRVSNILTWPIARDVRILLIRLEDIGPNGEPRLLWGHDEGVPLRWRFQEIHPLLRTIGRPADADLCSVREAGPLRLHPIIFPFNLPLTFTGQTDIFVSFQALERRRIADISPPAVLGRPVARGRG